VICHHAANAIVAIGIIEVERMSLLDRSYPALDREIGGGNRA
jgi:hypothetical protein